MNLRYYITLFNQAINPIVSTEILGKLVAGRFYSPPSPPGTRYNRPRAFAVWGRFIYQDNATAIIDGSTVSKLSERSNSL